MIKGLIFDIGDILYDIPLKYKYISPFMIKIGVEQILFKITSFMVKLGFYKKQYTENDIEKLRKKIKPREGVIDTLKALKKRKIKIVLLTDTIQSPEKVNSRLEALGVLGYIDCVVCSSQIGTYKPHKEAYDAAVKATKAKQNEVMFVGHAKDELEGASKAGLRTIGYNMDRGATSDCYAERFSDIISVIGELNAKRRHNRH
ncbi:MAG: HAD family hydrolase [Candidatus Nanoarchaeia archaeon]|nr:HAD family hydrolase [Candidatus Nanoarchaeia archaeon]MDD5239584.1 HAD family hydrolase [Candidatus Nanoarchaeia archaeon]